MSLKRIFIATILGFIAGLICYFGGRGKVEYTAGLIAATILNRTLIGFAIGISGLRMNYLLHGAILGLIFTLPLAVMAPTGGALALLFAGIVYGLVIEFLTTKVFKAPKPT